MVAVRERARYINKQSNRWFPSGTNRCLIFCAFTGGQLQPTQAVVSLDLDNKPCAILGNITPRFTFLISGYISLLLSMPSFLRRPKHRCFKMRTAFPRRSWYGPAMVMLLTSNLGSALQPRSPYEDNGLDMHRKLQDCDACMEDVTTYGGETSCTVCLQGIFVD